MSKFLERFKDKIHKMNKEGELVTDNKYQIPKQPQRPGCVSPGSTSPIKATKVSPMKYHHTSDERSTLPVIPHRELSNIQSYTPQHIKHPRSNLNYRRSLDLQHIGYEESKAFSVPHSPAYQSPFYSVDMKERLSKLHSLQVHEYDVQSKNSGEIKSKKIAIKSLSNSLLYSSNKKSVDYQARSKLL
jgi:hypothetical protein